MLAMTPQGEASAVDGLNVLILEDELMVAMLLEDMLSELGCRVVGSVSNADAALALLSSEKVDVALVDVNLSNGASGYPVAEALTARGIPFAFVTGYGAGGLDPAFRNHSTLQKPFHLSALVSILAGMAAGVEG